MDTLDLTRVDVVEFFNLEFHAELSSLNKIQTVLDRLTKYEEELQCEVSPYCKDPDHVNDAIKIAENALIRIRNLKEKWNDLEISVSAKMLKMKSIKDDFYSKIKQLNEIESLNNYLKWVLKVEDENILMEEALKNNDIDQMVEKFSKFKEFWNTLRMSDCKNLVLYVEQTMLYWHDILKDKLGSEFQNILTSLHWPVLSTNIRLPANQAIDVLLKFKQLFLCLCKVSLPDVYIKMQDIQDGFEDLSLLLPIQFMIQPLQKRFLFHFLGKKPTNRLDKPEWYLTQVLTWISDHSLFLEKIVQPLLENEGLSQFNAHMQMMKGLVRLAIFRFKSDLSVLLEDDRLLSHTIDEILLFSQELRNQGYPPSYPDILQILTSEPCFSRWRSLEHQSALEKMDKILSLETAWSSRYQEESNVDDMNVPESAELFITLLLTMTERYCNLSRKDCQVSFLELQLELLDDFRLRLHQLSQCDVLETIHPNFCGIMNAIYYVSMVLEEWNNLPFFLQLHAYRKKKNLYETILKDKQHLNVMKKNEIKAEELIEASVFDEIIELFNHMQNDFLQTLSDRVMLDIKAKSRPYRKEKWFCIPAVRDKKTMEISLSAYPMLEVVNTSLNRLQELLAKPLFTKIWQHIASELNSYLYEEVILQNNFSEGGAAQFNFDMTRNLFPIFGGYTIKPENYFRLVKDSCILLNLNSAAAMLLKETIKHADSFKAKSNALEELGVYGMTPSQVLIILSQRNYADLK